MANSEITPQTVLSLEGSISHDRLWGRRIADSQRVVGAIATQARATIQMPTAEHFYLFRDQAAYRAALKRLGRSNMVPGFTGYGQSLILMQRNDTDTMQALVHEMVHNTEQRSTRANRPLKSIAPAWNHAGVQMLTIEAMRRMGWIGYNPSMPALVAIGNALLPEMTERKYKNINATGLLHKMFRKDVLTGSDDTLKLMRETHGSKVVDLWKTHGKNGDHANDLALAKALGLTEAVDLIGHMSPGAAVDPRLLVSRWS